MARFRMAVFSAVIIAGLTAQAFSGPYLYLGFPKVTVHVDWILTTVALVAVCGLAGALFAKTLLWLGAYRKRFASFGQQAS